MSTQKVKSVIKPTKANIVPIKKKMTPKRYIFLVVFTFCFDFGLWAVYRYLNNEFASIAIPIVMVIFTLIMAPQLIYYGIKYFVKLIILIFRWGFKRPKLFFPCLAGVFVLILLGVFIFKKTEFTRDQYYLGLLQDQMTSVAYMKSVGDSMFVLNKPVPVGWDATKLQTANIDTQNNLFDVFRGVEGSKIEGYYFSALSWVLDIYGGASVQETWTNIGAQPPEFTISLNGGDFGSAIEKSFDSIMKLKEFSELAVLNNDKEAMRSVEARLLVQMHWLENLAYSEESGFWADGIFPIAHAVGPRTFRTCNGFLPCTKLPQNLKLIQGVWHSTHSYTVGEPSETSTTDAWTNLEAGVAEAGIPLGGAGLQVGPDNTTKLSPKLEQFYADCKGKGGIVGGTGGVMTRLPTTEGGSDCWSENGKCWDRLTYSGARYKGGGPGCEEQGLVPAPNVVGQIEDELANFGDDLQGSLDNFGEIISNIITPKWDGTYNTQFTGTGCSGLPQVEGFNPNTYLANVFNSYMQFVVTRDSVGGFPDGYIDANGKASMHVTASGYGTSTTIRFDLQFAGTGPGRALSGMMYYTASVPGANVKCSANITGAIVN